MLYEMKKILNNILILGICAAFFSTSCVEKFAVGDAFLEKAPGVDVNILTLFSRAPSILATSSGAPTDRSTAPILQET